MIPVLIPTTGSTCIPEVAGGPLTHVVRDLSGLHRPTRAARRLVQDALTGTARQEWVDDVVLVADELVGNAYQHTGTAGVINFALDLYPWGAVVQVSDGCADIGVVPVHPDLADEDAEGTRGLFLVDVLASSWGVQPVEGGKRIVAVFLHRTAGADR